MKTQLMWEGDVPHTPGRVDGNSDHVRIIKLDEEDGDLPSIRVEVRLKDLLGGEQWTERDVDGWAQDLLRAHFLGVIHL